VTVTGQGKRPARQGAMMSEDDCVPEDDCAICGHWPARDRWALRAMLDTLPMVDEVCDACLVAFWKCVAGPGPTQH
jgi:hypothetical protein